MLRVPIEPTLVEQLFRSGYKLGYLIEVLAGLPADAQLKNAVMEDGLLVLYFSQIRVPDTEVETIQIVLRSIAATPVEAKKG